MRGRQRDRPPHDAAAFRRLYRDARAGLASIGGAASIAFVAWLFFSEQNAEILLPISSMYPNDLCSVYVTLIALWAHFGRLFIGLNFVDRDASLRDSLNLYYGDIATRNNDTAL